MRPQFRTFSQKGVHILGFGVGGQGVGGGLCWAYMDIYCTPLTLLVHGTTLALGLLSRSRAVGGTGRVP